VGFVPPLAGDDAGGRKWLARATREESSHAEGDLATTLGRWFVKWRRLCDSGGSCGGVPLVRAGRRGQAERRLGE
jgi:hypothetical protein